MVWRARFGLLTWHTHSNCRRASRPAPWRSTLSVVSPARRSVASSSVASGVKAALKGCVPTCPASPSCWVEKLMSVTDEHPQSLPTSGRILGGFEPGVGFIGLGDMGGRIAQRILAAGFPLTVYDSSANACHKLRERGAAVAEQAELVGRQW